MANPREQTGVSITSGRIPSRLDSLANNFILSVPDVFSIRIGAYYNIKNWAFSAGIRNEGSPVYDLIGGSEGLRRPGHVFSVEPGFIYKMKKVSLYAYIPVTMNRKVSQSVPDKFKSAYTGTYIASQGGTGNYQIFAGGLFKL